MSANLDQKCPQPCSLSLFVADEEGGPVLGNVFIVVHHKATGQKWRALRYNHKTRSYVYPAIPAGRFSIRVTAAGFRSAEKVLTLRGAESRSVNIPLEPERHDAPLLLDVGPELEEYQRFAADLFSDRDLRARFCALPEDTLRRHLSGRDTGEWLAGAGLSLHATFLAALMNDERVVNALSEPTYALGPEALSGWIESRLRAAWVFQEAGVALENIIRSIVERRVRLFALVRAVMRNAVVRIHLPPLDDAQVTSHMLRFISSLDAPKLDSVMPILVQLLNPELAHLERFARGLLQTFDARVPTGVAHPAGPAPTVPGGDFDLDLDSFSKVITDWQADERTPTEEGDAGKLERVAFVMFIIADISNCLTATACASSLDVESLRGGKDFS